MGKLSNIKPRIGVLAPAVGRLTREEAERTRLRERDQNVDWRGWYKTARWQALRKRVLQRDAYVCRKTGALLIGTYPAPNSPVVDHIRPHRGDAVLFWDEANLQTVAKSWHDAIKQAIEKADGRVAAIHPKWLQPSLIPLTIVCGPPASGKSAYVRVRSAPGDLVVDLDVIASDISGEPLHGWDHRRWLDPALFRRNNMLGDLSRPGPHAAAWLIVSEAKAKHRAWWERTLRPRAIVVLETPEADCIANIMADPGRSEADRKTAVDAVVRWWFDYDARPGEIRVGGGGSKLARGVAVDPRVPPIRG